jgi:IS605 OrfB family transposase
MEQFVFNIASQEHFGAKKNSLVILHSKVYHKTRAIRPDIPSQVVIKAEQACLSAYKSVKSNKHKIEKAIVKKGLSLRLDKRLYSCATKEGIKITTKEGRKEFKYLIYPKLKELLDKYKYRDPLIFKKNGELWIELTFEVEDKELKSENIALGVDLGMRVTAACSDGRLIIDRKYNKEKRKLRFLKRSLQSKRTKSAKRHLKKLKHKERNKSKNQSYLVANEILKTKAGTIVLEDLTGIKKNKSKHQNKRAIAQVPFFKLKEILTYKARMLCKKVI